jgi:hypothetical protein
MDFATIKTALVGTVLNTHPSTAALMADAMVRSLLALQPEAVSFMEASGSFSTVAGQVAYSSSDAGYPKGLLRFDRLYYDLGSAVIPVWEEDRDEVRRLQELGSVAYPNRAAWIEEKLHFGPAPGAAYTVKWNIVLDATKDTATGAAITNASTTQTNGWFTTGAEALKALALADYYATSPDQRPALAQSWQGMAALAITSIRRTQAQRLRLGGVVQVPSAFRTGLSVSEKRQMLHPGAPL